ncbi:MAG TPA: crotonase/enoyl-CoA hydratase family protein [Acidimicrobiia bacterium]|nr:crotonase/enoyl-CoA hydratase family protein [Acidimicrobiia bacterium]
MAEESLVLTEVRGRVLLITINRPQAMNSINKATAEAMGEALDQLDDDRELAVGVITGTGKGFSAGMDLKGFASGEFPIAGDRGFAGIAQRSARKPLIAAIEGFALAGGLEIALSCDIIVASREAKLGIPEVGVGLFAGAGALLRLPRRVGLGQAALLALTGKPISGEEGHRIGLVDRLTDAGSAVEEALTLAETISANAPLALAASKAVLVDGFTKPDAEFWQWQQQFFQEVFSSKDAIEGATAFAEKRKPNWQGE